MIRIGLQRLNRVLLFSLVLVAASGALRAQTFSHMLSFQGRLCATDGTPLPDGKYEVEFRIYDAEAGGALLWTETQTVIQIGGVFNVQLGTIMAFPKDLFTGGDRWLAPKVGGDPEMPERFQLTPSPWAIYAPTSGTDNDWTISGSNVYRASGNVGVGTNSPGHTLHVASGGERAVFADSTGASGTKYGVYGRLASTAGAGVHGEATASTGTANGVVGFTATREGSGVFGQNTNPSGENEGVFGVAWSSEGRGVFGYNGASSGDAFGVFGRTASTAGRGVYGEALSGSGTTCGVYGQTHSPDGAGVYGSADGDGYGVRGYSVSGWPILGLSPNGSGKLGVLGAIVADNGGILYWHDSGVVGTNQGGYGVTGRSLEGIGVYGLTESGTGLRAYNEDARTRADLATPTHAGYFEGDIHTTGEYTKAYTPGTASLAAPIAYATIDKNTGAVLAGTPNVTGTWNSTYSRYEITIAGENYNFNTYVTTVTPIQGSADRRAVTDAVSGRLLVFIRDASGNLVQSWFSFVVYKP